MVMRRRIATISLSVVVVSMILVIDFPLASGRAFAADISASGNTGNPSTTSNYSVTGPQVVIVENVVLAPPSAGPWLTKLTNDSGGGKPSGLDTTMIELLTNTGTLPWTGWHQKVDTRTTISNPNDSPGFLFDKIHLQVSGDYGSGFVTLTEGVDYTVSPTLYSGPPDPGNNGQWEAVDILLSPARTIAPGNSLRIDNDIFEVFGDGNGWQPGEVAQVSQYPLPEPAGATLCLLAGGAAALRRSRR
jgi:hypothetical protein